MKQRTKRNSKGFTLIEVIVTIVIVAILGTVLVSYMSGGVVKSSIPVIWVRQEFNLFETIEKITEEYQKAQKGVPWSSFNLVGFGTTIDSATYEKDGITVTNDYIDDSGASGTLASQGQTPTNILRVKLKKGDQTVTALFTR